MRFAASLRVLIANLFHRSEANLDMDEELRSHIQHRADDLERSGVVRKEAERRARVEFGGYERYKEESQKASGGLFFEILMQDLRMAFRVLRRSPGFAAAAVLTLALAIGANAVVFGILNGLILRPLTVPQPETLYGTAHGDGAGWQSYPNYLDLRDRSHSFDGLAGFDFVFLGIDTGKNPTPASAFAATGNYFDVLRIQPYLGRFFHGSDEHGPNSAPYIVLNYAYWHSHFQEDRGAVGRVVWLNKHPFTVLGVAPPGFHGTILFINPDFFLPMVNEGQVEPGYDPNLRSTDEGLFEVVGHLKPGVTPAQAVADMNAVQAYIAKTHPNEAGHQTSVLQLQGLTAFRRPAQAFFAGLMFLSGLILLAACANLGSLFAAHTADRSREVALRLALGSSRNRILRQLMTEAMLISLVGGALGLLTSVVLLRRLSVWRPFPGIPIHVPVDPDARVYAVALVLAVVSSLLFGIVPVRQVLRANPYEIVKAGPSARLGRRITLRDGLLFIQIAICGVLVTSSMVAVRGLMRSVHGDFGFDPQNTMTVSTNLAMAGYTGDNVTAMQKHMIEAMETIPGVQAAALVNGYPPLVYTAGYKENVFKSDTTELKPSNVAAIPFRYDISPGYFRAAGTALLAGRGLTWHDDKNSPPVAVVNRNFAGTIYGSVADAVGKYYKLQNGTRVEVVGVVEDGKYQLITEDSQPAMFLSFVRNPSSSSFLIVRSRRDPQQLASAMRGKLRDLDAGLPVDTKTWNDLLGPVLFPSRVATVALGVLGAMGAMLSITGIFGMAAYSVGKRLRELGIRVALGAQRKQVLQAALGRAVKLLACGSAAGLLLGLLATKVLAFIVYQATPRDPLVLAGVVLAMAVLGLVATWIPAQRALSVDPMILLREE